MDIICLFYITEMASTQASHIKMIENILVCSLCLDILNSPKTLPCTHSFCEACLQKYVNIQIVEGEEGIHCPLCRTFSKTGEFINNYIIEDLLDVYWQCTKDKVTQCFMCEKNKNKALWKCVDCKIRLCNECQKVHQKLPNCRAHKYVSVDGNVDHLIDKHFYYKSHTEHITDLYCLNCKMLICLKCKVTEHDDHKSESVNATLGSTIKEIKSKLNLVKNHLRKLQDERLTLQRQTYQVEEDYARQRNKCKEYKKGVLSQLQQWEDETLGALAETKQKNLGKLHKALKTNERQTKVKENVASLTNVVLSNAKGCSLFKALNGEVKNRLSEQQKITHSKVMISRIECSKRHLSEVSLKEVILLCFILCGLVVIGLSYLQIRTAKCDIYEQERSQHIHHQEKVLLNKETTKG